MLCLHLISLQEELGNRWSIPGIIKAGKDLQDHVQPSPSRPLFALGAFQVFHLAAIPWDGPAARTGTFKDEEEVGCGNADPGKQRADVQQLEQHETHVGRAAERLPRGAASLGVSSFQGLNSILNPRKREGAGR